MAPTRCPTTRNCATQANAIKRHTIDYLDHYLEQFEANVIAHGGQVVWCRTPPRSRTSF